MSRAAGRIELLISVVGVLVVPGVNAQTPSRQLPSPVQVSAITRSTAVFIENKGQFDPRVKFRAKVGGKTAWLTAEGIVFDVRRSTANDKAPSTTGSVAAQKPLETGLAWTFGRAVGEPRTLDRLVFAEDLLSAKCCSSIEGRDPQPGIYNYFQGRDSSQWHTNVRGFAEVVYRDVWPGVDLRVYGNGPNLEQEFVVRPGGDLSLVQVAYRGVDMLRIGGDGSLEVATAFGTLRETKPQIFQQIDGKRETVEGRYRLTSQTSYTFDVQSHDSLYALVIDPTLLYSTFLGGSAGYECCNYFGIGDSPAGIAVDGSGNAYVAGSTASPDFPTTVGAYSTTHSAGSFIGFVTKLNPTGSALIYSSYFTNQASIGAFTADSAGHAFLTGITFATYYGQTFPTTPNAYWPTNPNQSCASTDFFLTEISADGSSLAYSTCFNASQNAEESAGAIATDGNGKVFIAGGATGAIPTTPGAYQMTFPGGGITAFASVVDTTASGASSLVYSTYIGQPTPGDSVASSIAVDSFGKFYLTGWTDPGFPTTPGVFQPTHAGCANNGSNTCFDAFIAKLDPSLSGSQSLIYSTYLGGTGSEYPYGIAVDALGNAYVTGLVQYGGNFPITPGAFEASGSLFVTKLNAGGSQLVYSTFFNASGSASGIAVDSSGDAFVVGYTENGFPVTPNAFQPTFGGTGPARGDAFLAELNPAGSGLNYATYLGGVFDDAATGVALDQVGDAYVVGWTSSVNFPVTPLAFQPAINPGTPGCGGDCHPEDAFITKFPLGATAALSIAGILPTTGGNAGTVSPQITGTGFHAGAIAQLNCGVSPPITGTNLTVMAGGQLLNATFNLASIVPGTCDVQITNPDGTTATLSQSFTVQPGGAPNVRVQKIGSPPVPGRFDTYTFLAQNLGNTDAANYEVTETVDPTIFSLVSTSPPGVVDLATMAQASIVDWAIPLLPAHTSTTLTYSVMVRSSAQPNTPVVGGPYCSGPDSFEGILACLGHEGAALASCSECADACLTAIAGCSSFPETPYCWYPGYFCIACLVDVDPGGPAGCISDFKEAVDCVTEATCSGLSQTITNSYDPNALTGLGGVGAQSWVSGQGSLQYLISFENEPTAPVPAQQIVVTQPLSSNVVLSTLRLSGITIQNGTNTNLQVPIPPSTFNPPAGVNEFVTTVDLRPTQSLLVNVNATLNPDTRTLTWTLASIDPATGLPPLNPLVGVLPPGARANVAFSVTPQAGLATGTQVSDQAVVVFDANAPMSTGIWTNTIDNTPSVSLVAALAATQTTSCFRPQWTATDVGSGVQGTTIFVSDSGGPYTPWLTNTTSASAIYSGVAGHTYAFYSQATDLVGNVEATHAGPDATTSVPAGASCNGRPTIVGSVASNSLSGTTETLTLQLTNNGDGGAQNISINSVSLRTLVGTGSVTLSSPTAPISVGSLAAGATSTQTLTLNAPATVREYSITEAGTVQDVSGNTYSFSIAQAVIP